MARFFNTFFCGALIIYSVSKVSSLAAVGDATAGVHREFSVCNCTGKTTFSLSATESVYKLEFRSAVEPEGEYISFGSFCRTHCQWRFTTKEFADIRATVVQELDANDVGASRLIVSEGPNWYNPALIVQPCWGDDAFCVGDGNGVQEQTMNEDLYVELIVDGTRPINVILQIELVEPANNGRLSRRLLTSGSSVGTFQKAPDDASYGQFQKTFDSALQESLYVELDRELFRMDNDSVLTMRGLNPGDPSKTYVMTTEYYEIHYVWRQRFQYVSDGSTRCTSATGPSACEITTSYRLQASFVPCASCKVDTSAFYASIQHYSSSRLIVACATSTVFVVDVRPLGYDASRFFMSSAMEITKLQRTLYNLIARFTRGFPSGEDKIGVVLYWNERDPIVANMPKAETLVPLNSDMVLNEIQFASTYIWKRALNTTFSTNAPPLHITFDEPYATIQDAKLLAQSSVSTYDVIIRRDNMPCKLSDGVLKDCNYANITGDKSRVLDLELARFSVKLIMDTLPSSCFNTPDAGDTTTSSTSSTSTTTSTITQTTQTTPTTKLTTVTTPTVTTSGTTMPSLSTRTTPTTSVDASSTSPSTITPTSSDSEVTNELNDLEYQNFTSTNVTSALRTLFSIVNEAGDNLNEFDLELVSHILDKASEINIGKGQTDDVIRYFFGSLDAVMTNVSNEILFRSYRKYGATLRMLKACPKMSARFESLALDEKNAFKGYLNGNQLAYTIRSIKTCEDSNTTAVNGLIVSKDQFRVDTGAASHALFGDEEASIFVTQSETCRRHGKQNFHVFKQIFPWYESSSVLGNRVQFMAFRNMKLFQTGEGGNATHTSARMKRSTSDEGETDPCGIRIDTPNYGRSSVVSMTFVGAPGRALQPEQLTVSIQFRLPEIATSQKQLHGEYVGGFYSDAGHWSTDGCSSTSSKDGTYEGICNHLTDFTLLVKDRSYDPAFCDSALRVVGYILCGFSAFSLLMLLILFTLPSIPTIQELRIVERLTGPKGNTGGVLGLPFLATLLLFFVLFILFAEQTFLSLDDATCEVAAAFLYATLMSVVLWTVFQGLEIIKRFYGISETGKVLEAITKWPITVPICTVTPILITLPQAFFNVFQRGDGFCWINPLYIVYSVVIPMTLMLVSDAVFTAILIYQLFYKTMPNDIHSRRNSSQNARRKEMYQKLIVLVSMQVILGAPWVLQYFTLGFPDVTWAHWVFTVWNAAQGLLLGLMYLLIRYTKQPKRKRSAVTSSTKASSPTVENHVSPMFPTAANPPLSTRAISVQQEQFRNGWVMPGGLPNTRKTTLNC